MFHVETKLMLGLNPWDKLNYTIQTLYFNVQNKIVAKKTRGINSFFSPIFQPRVLPPTTATETQLLQTNQPVHPNSNTSPRTVQHEQELQTPVPLDFNLRPIMAKSKTKIEVVREQKWELALATGINPFFVDGRAPSSHFCEFNTVFKNFNAKLQPWIIYDESKGGW